VNQAWAGHPGFLSKGPGNASYPQEVWSKPLSNGRIAVLMINQGNATATVTIDARSLHANDRVVYRIRDVWRHTDAGTTPPHPHAPSLGTDQTDRENTTRLSSAPQPSPGDLLSATPCHTPSTPNQSWKWQPGVTSGQNRAETAGHIELAGGKLCVAASNFSTFHQPPTEVRACDAVDPAQSFMYAEATLRITHVPSGLCLVCRHSVADFECSSCTWRIRKGVGRLLRTMCSL
jgi:hypothetical protein